MRPSNEQPGRELLGKLRSFGARSGALLGDLYAHGARALLSHIEQLEDQRAERRQRRRRRLESPRSTPNANL